MTNPTGTACGTAVASDADEDRVRQIAFTCGGVNFSLTMDDDGRWDHNKHGERVLNSFGGGESKIQIEIVETLCELMTEGLDTAETGSGDR